jgi:hypothetical protein
MRSRDESVAIRALIAAVEANTEALKLLGAEVRNGFEMVNTKLDATMDALADHVTTMHGEDS